MEGLKVEGHELEMGGISYLEPYTQEGGDLEAHFVTQITESADLTFVFGHAGWDGLLGLAVDELAKVEGSTLSL